MIRPDLDLFTKTCHVIDSCETVEQLEVANKYSTMALRKMLDDTLFQMGKKAMECAIFVSLIEAKKLDIRARSIARDEIADALDRLGLFI